MELDTMNEVCDILASSCLILHLTEGILIYVCMISWVIILTIMPFFYWQCMYIQHEKLGSYQNHKSLLTKYLLMCYWQNWPLSQLGYFVIVVIHLSVHFMRDIQEARLLALIEGVLAANIFDWGSRACVELYHKGTIIEIYRMSRKKMQRPWRASIPSLNI